MVEGEGRQEAGMPAPRPTIAPPVPFKVLLAQVLQSRVPKPTTSQRRWGGQVALGRNGLISNNKKALDII